MSISAAEIKSGRTLGNKLPREGTALRDVYDRLLAGDKVSAEQLSQYRFALECTYDLELRIAESDKRRNGRKVRFYELAGRWDGPYFVKFEGEMSHVVA